MTTTFKKDGNDGYNVFSNGVKVGNVRQYWDGWRAQGLSGEELATQGYKTRALAAQDIKSL